MTTSSSASTRFGLDLLRLLTAEKPNSNAFISPYSISIALSMTHLGANGETAEGMTKALRWEQGKEADIHEENRKYISLLQNPNENYALTLANRLFVEKGYHLESEFLEKTQSLYLAGAEKVDFSTKAEEERVKINSWVTEQTRSKINDLLAPGVVDSLTRMVLVNAIYFKGDWQNKFSTQRTKPQPFRISQTTTKQVDTMFIEEKYNLYMDNGLDGFSALELPYKGNDLSMVILLPTETFGLSALEKSLTYEKLVTLFSNLKYPEKVVVRLPKFEMTSSFHLKSPLCQLGMTSAFDPNKSDFSKMSATNDLVMSEVVHKAFVKVDEEGTEAAAATGVMMMTRCLPRPPPEFNVDRPFLFVIRDRRGEDSGSGSVLFIGRITDPSSSSSG